MVLAKGRIHLYIIRYKELSSCEMPFQMGFSSMPLLFWNEFVLDITLTMPVHTGGRGLSHSGLELKCKFPFLIIGECFEK